MVALPHVVIAGTSAKLKLEAAVGMLEAAPVDEAGIVPLLVLTSNLDAARMVRGVYWWKQSRHEGGTCASSDSE